MKIISSLCFLNHTFTIFSCILGPNMESRGRHGQLLFIPRHILDCLESSIHIIFDSGLPLPSQSKVYFFLLNTFSVVTFIFISTLFYNFFLTNSTTNLSFYSGFDQEEKKNKKRKTNPQIKATIFDDTSL